MISRFAVSQVSHVYLSPFIGGLLGWDERDGWDEEDTFSLTPSHYPAMARLQPAFPACVSIFRTTAQADPYSSPYHGSMTR